MKLRFYATADSPAPCIRCLAMTLHRVLDREEQPIPACLEHRLDVRQMIREGEIDPRRARRAAGVRP